MIVKLSPLASKQHQKLTQELQKSFKKQTGFLKENRNHPSLNAKPVKVSGFDLWQARINQKYRFYFLIEESFYYITAITNHPK